MKDGGVIKKEELHVEGKDTTTLKVTIPSATSDKHEPQWVSVTLKVENVKEVKVTPNDKSGKSTDSPKTTEVSQTATTVEVKFETSPHADHLTVVLTKSDNSKPVKSDVTSAKACLPKNGTSRTTTTPLTSVISVLMRVRMVSFYCTVDHVDGHA